MQVASKGWSVQEEETIARIMGNENVGRIEAIQAMQRRKKTSKSLSHRLKLQDPLDSLARCQKRRCLECAFVSGESDSEMTAFLDIMLNGKQRSGENFLVQRDLRIGHVPGDPSRGLFPVSARMDDVHSIPVPQSETREWDLVPKEPYEPALELTKAGIVESRVYVRRAKSVTSEENGPSRPTEAIRAAERNVLMPILVDMDSDPMLFGNPNKALRIPLDNGPGRGRPKVPDDRKRLLAAERQARFRKKQSAKP